MSREELNQILELHRRWLEGYGEEHANLRGADLRDADFHRASLSGTVLIGANLDYSCWPLWCGSLGVIVDKRIAAQFAYHFCSVVCDDPEFREARNAILDFANQFHRVEECGRLERI